MNSTDLFETSPFLEQKLDSSVFEDIPQEPGIYRFYDEEDNLLYVGKAKNLRRRLFTYKRARPGCTSRKEAALISKIHWLEFDVLESEQVAILQENRWIREHRPEFNYANKYTETYYFITVQRSESALVFGLSMNRSGNLFPEEEKPLYREMHPPFSNEPDTKIYGCFKGHRTVRSSLGSLLQLLWMAEYNSVSPHFLPVQLSRNLTPMRFKMSFKRKSSININELMSMLNDWFLGNSPEIIPCLYESVPANGESGFTKNYLDETIEFLLVYFQKNLEKYRLIRELNPVKESHLIHQDELDDLTASLNTNLQSDNYLSDSSF